MDRRLEPDIYMGLLEQKTFIFRCMIDIGTNKLTLVHYPSWSGGNFLINCLALSDKCVFSKADLIQKQLQNTFGSHEKLIYLRSHLAQSKSDNSWDDLDLGCWQTFGLPIQSFAFANVDLHFLLEQYADPVMHDLSASGLRWFLRTHDTLHLRQYVRYWHNSKIIAFVNFEKFMRLRNKWVDRPSHWFRHDMFALDTEQVCSDLQPDRSFLWDCDWYLDQEQFLHHLDRCAGWLDLDLAESQDLCWYRNTWLSTIAA